MGKQSFFLRNYLAHSLLILFTFLLAGSVFSHQLGVYARGEKQSQLKTTAFSVARQTAVVTEEPSNMLVRELYGSCMHPVVMRQLAEKYDLFHAAAPKIEEFGIQVAIENHTDTFADEILWLVDRLNHPLIGTCVDTMNPLQVIENPYYAMERMLPKAYCCHFSDDIIVVDPLGVHDIGAPHGQGSMDCPRMIQQIRENSPMDRIIFENEIAFKSIDEPIEEARAREMDACLQSIRYLRDELKLGVRNR